MSNASRCVLARGQPAAAGKQTLIY